VTKFLPERFSSISRTRFFFAGNATFSKVIEQAPPVVTTKNFPTMFQDTGIVKIASDPPPKFLWLIPFTLAKKLLSYRAPVAKNNFMATVCGTKAHTYLRCVSTEFFWGKDPLVRNATCGYNKKN
jgi:hypothetical protein